MARWSYALLILFALLAGAGTALSPCVLPVLPAVLSAGVTGGRRRPLGVVTGLALSFTFATVALVYVIEALGLPNDFTRDPGDRRRCSVFGVLLLRAAARRPGRGLDLARRPRARARPGGTGSARGLLLGASLGLVYAPCAGPILAGVITVSAAQNFTVGRLAVALAYSIGLGDRALRADARRPADHRPPRRRRAPRPDGDGRRDDRCRRRDDRQPRRPLRERDRRPPALRARRPDQPASSRARASRATSRRSAAAGRCRTRRAPAEAAAGERLPDLRPGARLHRDPGVVQHPGRPAAQPRPASGGRSSSSTSGPTPASTASAPCPTSRPGTSSTTRTGSRWSASTRPSSRSRRRRRTSSSAIGEFGLTYPVAQDNDAATWNAYHNQYWPADYLIDAKGDVRLRALRRGRLRRDGGGDPEPPRRGGSAPKLGRPAAKCALQSARTPTRRPRPTSARPAPQRFANGPIRPGTPELRQRSRRRACPDQLAYGGQWTISGEDGDRRQRARRLELNFNASRVFLVLGSPGAAAQDAGARSTASRSRDALAGADVTNGTATISSQRLYRLVDLPTRKRTSSRSASRRASPATRSRSARRPQQLFFVFSVTPLFADRLAAP